MTPRPIAATVAACCAVLAVAGCGEPGPATATDSMTASAASATTNTRTASVSPGGSGTTTAAPMPNDKTFSADGLQISKTWVKAVPDLGKGTMTGVFGTIRNTSAAEIVITSASADRFARTELHETAMVNGNMQMRQVTGGYTIPAGGTFELKPGGNHLMIMDMTTPLPAGSTAKVTLITHEGKKVSFDAVAWAFPGGGNEPYATGVGAPTSTAS